MPKKNITQRIDHHISQWVVEFILTRETEELAALSRPKIAEVLGMDPLKMSQAFESDQHISLEEFIVREKMNRAFSLLETDPGISIKELAGKMGYLKTVEFAKAFENYFLIPPQRYRELTLHPSLSKAMNCG